MPERKEHKTVNKYVFDCDNCEPGEYIATGGYNLSKSAQKTTYQHVCKRCGSHAWLEKQYPVYEEPKVEVIHAQS